MSLLGPERVRVFDGLPVQTLIIIGAKLSGLARRIGVWEIADIEHGVSCFSCDVV
jgi:hypothetical protein